MVRTFRGAKNGCVQVGLNIFDEDVFIARHADLDAAGFVLTTAWPVDIPQPDRDALDAFVASAQHADNALLNHPEDGRREVETPGLYVDVHISLHIG
jgi:hypothetical protein